MKVFQCILLKVIKVAKLMHEWALAEAILTSANELAEKEKLKEVTEVIIRIGELQQIEPSILRFALKEMKPANFRKTRFHLLKAKTALKCRVCGTTWQFNIGKLDEQTAEAIHFVPEVAHTYIKCPKCGSRDFEILNGRGVWLESVKGAK